MRESDRPHIRSTGSTSVVSVNPETLVSAACVMMRDRHIGSLVVLDTDRLVGLVTERDIIAKVVAVGRSPTTTKVNEIMTRNVITCTPQTTTQQAKDLMAEHRIRHLPVMDGRRVVGMISSRDILVKQLRDTREIVRQQMNILQDLERDHPGITMLKKDERGRVVIQCN